MTAEHSSTSTHLTFVPFTTFIDPSFWSEVTRRKVNEWQLDQAPRALLATYSSSGRQPCLLSLSHDSILRSEEISHSGGIPMMNEIPIRGELLLANTKKEFLEGTDRKAILAAGSQKLWDVITTKRWLKDPDLLHHFYLTAWADIKQFTYSFWICIPALLFPMELELEKATEECSENIFHLCTANSPAHAHHPFLIVNEGEVLPLADIEHSHIRESNTLLVFHDPSIVAKQPGWPLRNLLAAIACLRLDLCSLRVLALRRHSRKESFILTIRWRGSPTPREVKGNMPPTLKAIGWERDSHGQLTHRSVDLSRMFDPVAIMEQSVDLNLKLIRWRQAPDVDLEKFTTLKALVVGSGTLGCNIARCLLGWGVRHFTLVDHAQLAYNNPIRQSLFTFADCRGEQEGEKGSRGQDKNKAKMAAAALKRIYPLVHAEGIDMKIPMPGHPYSANEKENVQKECSKLIELVAMSDVIFLVMDSRESRWLPTLLASVHNKLAITVALGFDSYVVMRHGVNGSSPQHQVPTKAGAGTSANRDSQTITPAHEVPASALGCYFCSDVTAPGNSMADRTLDQQCTITRAGVSSIASGVAVELMASLLQHSLGPAAPAHLGEVDENAGLLGGTPHQVRGFISRFHTMTPTVRRFQQCTACGDAVRQRYQLEGFAFLHTVFQQPEELERTSGLLELQQQAENIEADVLEMADGEDTSSGGEGR